MEIGTTLTDVASLTLRVFEGSRQRPSGGDPDVLIKDDMPQLDGISGGRDIMDVLRERKAARAYGEDAISVAAITTMLAVASDADSQDWPEERVVAPLEFRVVAWNVAALSPAIYAYHHETQSLERLGDAPDPRRDGAHLVLQPEFATAAAIVLITGALGSAIQQYGAWGHQNLLVRAGSAGHRLWLASMVCGLVGTVFAGFLPRAAQKLAGVDGYRHAGLFAYATGSPRVALRHGV